MILETTPLENFAVTIVPAAIKAKQGDYPEAQYNAGVVLGDMGRWEEAAASMSFHFARDCGGTK